MPTGGAGQPGHVIDTDVTHCAATAQVWMRCIQPVRAAHEDACPEGRVELVTRKCQVVGTESGKVDGSMRGELGSINDHPRTMGMRQANQFCHRPDLARHVAGTSDRQQQRSPRSSPHGGRGDLQGLLRTGWNRKDGGVVSVPGQQIGVVLRGVRDDRGPRGQGGGKQIDRISGVPGEYH